MKDSKRAQMSYHQKNEEIKEKGGDEFVTISKQLDNSQTAPDKIRSKQQQSETML